jgi:hypothetical protein
MIILRVGEDLVLLRFFFNTQPAENNVNDFILTKKNIFYSIVSEEKNN